MEILGTSITSALLILAIGIIIGAAINKILSRSNNSSELQKNLDETREQLENYQKEVGTHFQTTAELVNKLTQSYRDVHEHLSRGAQTLVQDAPEALEGTSFKALGEPSSENTEQEPTDRPETETESSETSVGDDPNTHTEEDVQKCSNKEDPA